MTWPAGLFYHQRTALLHNIVPYIEASGAESLLDIGAGSPAMAVPLSQHVREYCAVEQDIERAGELSRAGLDVIHGRFPVPLDKTYDLVLSCHSVPECSIESYPSFLPAAWACTSPTGVMLIVTFKGSRGAVEDLRCELLGAPNGPSPEYDAIVEHCTSFGRTEIRHVNSFVEAPAAADIAGFISPWLSGRQDVRDGFRGPLTQILETQYRVRQDLYVFPTRHLFISCSCASACLLTPAEN
jgi:hypothetical protein